MPDKCKQCGGQFRVSWIGGGVPGGKTLEIIECPHCGAEHGRQMTSAAPGITPIYDIHHPELLEQIRQRLKEVPAGGNIDALAYATYLANDFAGSPEDIRDIVEKECAATGISCFR
jgi:hypothetical protein